MAKERSVSDVFQDILRNLQEMVRSEIRLAKVEIRGEVKQAVSSAVWIAAGCVAAMSAWIFLLWTLAYALATHMPMWAAMLIVSDAQMAMPVGINKNGNRGISAPTAVAAPVARPSARGVTAGA